MPNVSISVLSTVNAPYGTNLSADELAARICGPASLDAFDASAFSFFSDVDAELQLAFIEEMGLDLTAVTQIAQGFAGLAGFDLPLGKRKPNNTAPSRLR